MNENIGKIAHVESIVDDADGLRIKARLNGESHLSVDELPYAFPWMPKFLHVMPKVGESVLIFNTRLGNEKSNRFFVGPIISQPQYMEKDEYDHGRGSSMSLLQGGYIEPLARISNYDSTENAFPNNDDIALIGRKSEDIIIKDGEIDLRCGIRKDAYGENDGLIGCVVRNDYNPSYIQLKYEPNMMKRSGHEGDSVANIVADRINIISHQTKTPYDQSLTSKGELIKSEDMDKLMEQLHPLPYGDVLVDILEKMRRAICYHLHPYPGMYPNNTNDVLKLNETDLNKVKSEYVRIS